MYSLKVSFSLLSKEWFQLYASLDSALNEEEQTKCGTVTLYEFQHPCRSCTLLKVWPHKLGLFHTNSCTNFMYLVFTCMPADSYCRQLRSLLLHLCDVFWMLNNSLACWSHQLNSFSDSCAIFEAYGLMMKQTGKRHENWTNPSSNTKQNKTKNSPSWHCLFFFLFFFFFFLIQMQFV